jgi:hypothetical protein
VLVSGQGRAVDAQVAVHDRLAGESLVVALQHHRGHGPHRAQIGAHGHLHVEMGPGPRAGLGADAVHQHPGEQEVGDHHHPPRPQPPAPVEHLGDRGRGQRHEGRLHPPEPPPVPHQAGHLAQVGVGVGVGGAPTHEDHEDVAVSPLRGSGCPRRHRLPGAGLGQGQDGGVDAEVAGVPEHHARMALPGPAQGRGPVVLQMAGAEEDKGDGHHRRGAPRHQRLDALVEPGPGQLDESAAHRQAGGGVTHDAGQAPVLGHSRRGAAAVAHQHQSRPGPVEFGEHELIHRTPASRGR